MSCEFQCTDLKHVFILHTFTHSHRLLDLTLSSGFIFLRSVQHLLTCLCLQGGFANEINVNGYVDRNRLPKGKKQYCKTKMNKYKRMNGKHVPLKLGSAFLACVGVGTEVVLSYSESICFTRPFVWLDWSALVQRLWVLCPPVVNGENVLLFSSLSNLCTCINVWKTM